MEFSNTPSLLALILLIFVLIPSLSYGSKLAGAPSTREPMEINNPTDLQMVERYSFKAGSPKWSKSHLIYAFHNGVPPYAMSPIRRCLERWSAASNFTFEETSVFNEADVKFSFEKGEHGDGHPFDGPGGFLAHTLKPPSGIVHFDEEERWSVASVPGFRQVDLETIAMHEAGHLLGLGHSRVQAAVMYEDYFIGTKKRKLHQDDIQGIRSLYDLH